MGYQKILIRSSYNTDNNNSILNDFYIPVLNQTKTYKRAVGYFNSRVLLHIVDGLEGLIRNNGKMQLIVCPELEDDDIKAIKEGYELREIINNRIIRITSSEYCSYKEFDNLKLLRELVKDEIVEIKIAIMKNHGIYHEKIGVLTDLAGKKLAFTGSLNETYAAIFNNYESIDVFKSWIPNEYERIVHKEKNFDLLWSNMDNKVDVFDFPTVIFNKIIENYNEYTILQKEAFVKNNVQKEGPYFCDEKFALRNYQLEAIINWKNNKYKGLLAMATGTGKTLTAISSLVSLWEKDKESLFTIIVCPYTHLVEQWVEDLEKFNVKAIISYGEYRWEKKLKNYIRSINYDFRKFVCVITTNDTYSTSRFQNIIRKVKTKRLIIVDEAHNFGSKKIREIYDDSIEYRLGLSATPVRYFDDEGSQNLLKYFDKIVYELSLEKAISIDCLTKYYYYPILVYLNNEEFDEYKKLSLKISKIYAFTEKKSDNANLTTLLIKRSRILNLAENKLTEFKKLIQSKSNTYNNLVYCASGNLISGEKQIDAVTKLLGNNLNMKIQKFTAEENKDTRTRIIKDFSSKETQCIVAIRCLDEGVNIPSIETAYILASSGNEKEFIQRRGRVLRKYPGKRFARIYDFVVLPRNLDEVCYLDQSIKKIDRSIISKELRRMKEFCRSSINQFQGEKIILDIEKAYEIIY